VLGNPATTVLFGDQPLDHGHNSGGYIELGGWLNPDQTVGFQASGFMLETHTIHGEANAADSGAPVIARPFFNVLTGAEDAYVITAPAELLGGIDIFSDSRFWGAEANLVAGSLYRGGRLRADLLAGFRYLGLKDEHRFDQSSTHLLGGTISFLGEPVLNSDIISVRDMYETHDQFYGGQLGLRGELRQGSWLVMGVAKAGLGGTVQELKVSGHTLRTGSDGRARHTPGGLFTQPSNLGQENHGTVSFVCEGGARVGWQATRWLALQLGYTIIYWSDVVRPGKQIDRVVNPDRVPSEPSFGNQPVPARPTRLFKSTDFWGQGLDAGVEFRF
jgi:hypothetical protein